MQEVKMHGRVIARHIKQADIKEGLNFFSGDDEFIQVGAWKYDSDKKLQSHIHNKVERTIDRTNEVLYVVSGALEATIYALDETIVDSFVVEAGDLLVLMECGHGYRILKDGTNVIEIKNGPYMGAEVDRRRF